MHRRVDNYILAGKQVAEQQTDASVFFFFMSVSGLGDVYKRQIEGRGTDKLLSFCSSV